MGSSGVRRRLCVCMSPRMYVCMYVRTWGVRQLNYFENRSTYGLDIWCVDAQSNSERQTFFNFFVCLKNMQIRSNLPFLVKNLLLHNRQSDSFNIWCAGPQGCPYWDLSKLWWNMQNCLFNAIFAIFGKESLFSKTASPIALQFCIKVPSDVMR